MWNIILKIVKNNRFFFWFLKFWIQQNVAFWKFNSSSSAEAELGGCQGGPLPPKNFAWPRQCPPKIFRVTSCHWSRSLSESPTQTIDSSLVAKLAPPVDPPNENVWLRPCSSVINKTDDSPHQTFCILLSNFCTNISAIFSFCFVFKIGLNFLLFQTG